MHNIFSFCTCNKQICVWLLHFFDRHAFNIICMATRNVCDFKRVGIIDKRNLSEHILFETDGRTNGRTRGWWVGWPILTFSTPNYINKSLTSITKKTKQLSVWKSRWFDYILIVMQLWTSVKNNMRRTLVAKHQSQPLWISVSLSNLIFTSCHMVLACPVYFVFNFLSFIFSSVRPSVRLFVQCRY